MPTRSKTYSYDTGEEPERASTGIIERHRRQGRIEHPPSDHAYPVPERTSYPGDEQAREETKLVYGNDVALVSKSTFYDYEGRINFFLSHSLAHEQGSRVYGGNPCA